MKSLTEKKRVLFVAYQFPPAGGIGVHRVVKFVKYLPEFGWESSVLTVSNPSVPLTDQSHNHDIPATTEIVRAATWEPGYRWKQKLSASTENSSNINERRKKNSLGLRRKFTGLLKQTARRVANTVLQPDMQILWARQAIRAGRELLRRVPHDVIIATAPPFSSFYVGEQLSKHSGVPLVLDYRDEWGISNAYWENKQQDGFSQWVQKRMQQRLLRNAHAAIATTPSSCRSVQETAHSAGAKTICEYIYNGYDPADFASVSPASSSRKDYGNGVDLFRLSYVGTLWNLNSIEPLVQAIELLNKRSPQLTARLEFVLAGRRTAEQETLLDRLQGLPCRVVRLPFISHEEAVRLMQTSDCLALLNSPLPGAERIVNGKIFEYLAAEKPFLLISPPGDMWDLTSDCPYALPCDPHQPAKIADGLAHELECQRMGVMREKGLWTPQQHERRHRAKQLAELLDRWVISTPLDMAGEAEKRRETSVPL